MTMSRARKDRRLERRRQQRVRKERKQRISRAFFITISAIVGILVIGSFGLSSALGVFGSPNTPANQGPQIGDHWHAALSVNVCGSNVVLPPSPGSIHSHGDGAIHIHPQEPGDTEENANIDRFLKTFPMILTSDRIQVPGGKLYENGDKCTDGDPGEVQVLINKTDKTDSFLDYSPRDGDIIGITFK